MIQKAISPGRFQININTECQLVFAEATRKYIEAGKDHPGKASTPASCWLPALRPSLTSAKEKIELHLAAQARPEQKRIS